MSYVNPNSTIFLIKKIPLTPSGIDTFYWDNPVAQSDYFLRQDGIWLERNSYQRANKNMLRIAKPYEECYQCNYLMFKNASHENKWFYAFITKVDYVNEQTSEITYELDLLQTWFFNWLLPPCMIERNHTRTDVFGSNLVPEDIENDSYVLNNNTDVDGIDNLIYRDLNATSVVIASGEKLTQGADPKDANSWTPNEGEFKFGIYSGIRFDKYPIVTLDANNNPQINDTNVQAVNDFISNYTIGNKKDSIANIFMFPTAYLDEGAIANRFPYSKEYWLSKANLVSGTLDGHTVRNNKLYTFPYNCICCTSGYGNLELYGIEYFDGDYAKFKINAEITNQPMLEFRPTNYKMENTLDHIIQMSNFPRCAYNIDMFKEWVGNGWQHTLASATKSFVGGMATLTMGALTENPALVAGGIGAIVGGPLNAVFDYEYAKTLGGKVFNASPNTAIRTANVDNSFHVYQYCYNKYKLEIIDDFFTMFGYQINKIEEPRINNRSYFTYIKTIDSKCYGNLPAEDAREIENKFNNGLRFWKYPDTIYNYNVPNQPLDDMAIVG